MHPRLPHPSRPFLLTIGVWLAAVALAVQMLTLPISALHHLQNALDNANATSIFICTPHGPETLRVAADGQPLRPLAAVPKHCPICLNAGTLLLVASFIALFLLVQYSPLRPRTPPATAVQRASLRPPSQAPPLPV